MAKKAAKKAAPAKKAAAKKVPAKKAAAKKVPAKKAAPGGNALLLALGRHADALTAHALALDAHTDALRAVNVDAVVDGCVRAASGGADFDDDSVLNGIPVVPNDMTGCLNHGLGLVNQRYERDDIDGGWTVGQLKDDARSRS